MDDNVFVNSPQPQSNPLRLVTIVSVVSGGVTVKFDGEDAASSKPYKCNPNYTPTANDRAVLAWISGSGVILCKFI